MAYMGNTNLRHAATLSYNIPMAIPSSASELLIYVKTESGYSSTSNVDIEVFTQVGVVQYKKYTFT